MLVFPSSSFLCLLAVLTSTAGFALSSPYTHALLLTAAMHHKHSSHVEGAVDIEAKSHEDVGGGISDYCCPPLAKLDVINLTLLDALMAE